MLFLRGIEFGSGLWLGLCLTTVVFFSLIIMAEWIVRCLKRAELRPDRHKVAELLSMSDDDFDRFYRAGPDKEWTRWKKPPVRVTVSSVIAWKDRRKAAKGRGQRVNDYTDDRIG